MPPYLPHDTRQALADKSQLICENRSLFFDRFADPCLEKTERKNWFQRGAKIIPEKRDRSSFFPSATHLFAQLKARLMVNMAGGVMENAGLCLDRRGLPHIPGSAVKGCARRMALQALRDWCPESERPSGDHLSASSCQAFQTRAEMLHTIALVFGWVEQDWPAQDSPQAQNSDFAWACHDSRAVADDAASSLCRHLQAKIANPENPAASLPNFAGTIAFLAAFPNHSPALDLEIVNCHHPRYYMDNTDFPVALDTEDPIPVYFPAIPSQTGFDHFAFPLIPLRRADDPRLAASARAWLSAGLEYLGIGAKTNAGYGWFDASDEFNEAIRANLEKTKLEKKRSEEKEAADKKEAEKRTADLANKNAREAKLKGLSPAERADAILQDLTDPQFEGKVRHFCKDAKKGGPSDEEKQAIVRALRGPRLAYWEAFKLKATKGDLAAACDQIRTLSKTMNLGKMP